MVHCFDNCPNEILALFFERLDFLSHLCLSTVSKRLHSISELLLPRNDTFTEQKDSIILQRLTSVKLWGPAKEWIKLKTLSNNYGAHFAPFDCTGYKLKEFTAHFPTHFA